MPPIFHLLFIREIAVKLSIDETVFVYLSNFIVAITNRNVILRVSNVIGMLYTVNTGIYPV